MNLTQPRHDPGLRSPQRSEPEESHADLGPFLEERVLFPVLGTTMDGPITVMVEEHRTIHGYLGQSWPWVGSA
jgi:hypothetical protein